MNFIKIIDIPWFNKKKKLFGIEIKTSSDGEWQITSKNGMRHVDIFSLRKGFMPNEPTVLILIVAGLSVTVALDEV